MSNSFKPYIHQNGWCEYKIGSGQPIVMLHGLGYSAEIMFPLAAMLSKYFQIILFDLPGFGNSSFNLHELSLDVIASELFQICPPQANYIGWSLGNLFTQYLAYKHPQTVNKLITIAGSPCFVSDGQWFGISQNTLDQFQIELKENFNSAIKKFVWNQLYPKNKLIYQEILEIIFKNMPVSSDIYFLYLNLLIKTDLRPILPLITAKQLYLLGKMDPLVPNNTTLFQHLPNIKIFELDCGHIPFISHLHQTSIIIKAFLNES